MNIISCPVCGKVHQVKALQPGTAAQCQRCNATLQRWIPDSITRTLALSVAALILYVPANILPILHMDLYGAVSDSTVWQGCVRLYQDGDHIVAAIVFLASMVIPLCKLCGLFLLTITSASGSQASQKMRSRLHHLIEVAGPWAMLDVFIVAVLISLVKLKKLATILPGPGLLSFSGVVILTILASASFDPRAIWQNPRIRREQS